MNDPIETNETEHDELATVDHEDAVLLKTVRNADPVHRVDTNGISWGINARQSHSARAWTMGGQVD